MSRIPPAEVDGNIFQKMMGHCPDIVEKWFALDSTMRFGGQLDPELKEEVRRSLAKGVGCRFCASLGDPDPSSHDRRTALAVAFADKVMKNFHDLPGIDDEVFEVLKDDFTDPEIVELSIWTLFMIAGQGFGALMKIRESSAEELTEYSAWRAAGKEAGRLAS